MTATVHVITDLGPTDGDGLIVPATMQRTVVVTMDPAGTGHPIGFVGTNERDFAHEDGHPVIVNRRLRRTREDIFREAAQRRVREAYDGSDHRPPPSFRTTL